MAIRGIRGIRDFRGISDFRKLTHIFHLTLVVSGFLTKFMPYISCNCPEVILHVR